MKTVTRLAATRIVLILIFPVLSFAQIGSPPETLFGARLDYARNYLQIESENFSSTTDAVTLTYQF